MYKFLQLWNTTHENLSFEHLKEVVHSFNHLYESVEPDDTICLQVKTIPGMNMYILKGKFYLVEWFAGNWIYTHTYELFLA